MGKLTSVEEAISSIPTTARIFIQGGAATPNVLINELIKQAPRFQGAEIIHIHTHGPADYAKKEYRPHFRVVNLFVGANLRPYLDMDQVDYLPCFLSEIPQLFRRGIRKPDVALIHVSPPDRHGYCSLGTSVDVTKAAIDTSPLVIAQINPRMPRVMGDGIIHVRQINATVEIDEPLHCSENHPLTEVDLAIGRHASELVEDGATIQTGIGNIPNAVLASLRNHKNLGVHSEMWSDGTLDLIQLGVVNNSLKRVHMGKTVSSFLLGSQRLYDFVDDNPAVIQLDASYVNNPHIIARNNKVTSINSAVEIDLTGQVCADSVGSRIISGVGGQIDFIRGASLSEGGKPILAITSRTQKGTSRIVTHLKYGAGVVTSRAHVHFVVTEYGVANLFGKTTKERALSLIKIAHPDDREKLSKEWHDSYSRK